MGCTASKVANEDVVRRCKERRRLMKDAVTSRHNLAAAHSDYLRSLRLTASALSLFASFQSLSVSDHTPPVLLHSRAPPPPPSLLHSVPALASSLSSSSLPPPPPSPPPPIPPLLPESQPKTRRKGLETMSTYSTTTSSSVWNWENFYPPSPPGSEYYDRLSQQRRGREEQLRREQEQEQQQQQQQQRRGREEQLRREQEQQQLQLQLQQRRQQHQYGGDHHHLPEEDGDSDEDGGRTREEVQRGEWEERYSRTSSSSRSEDEMQHDSVSEMRSEYYGGPPASDLGMSPLPMEISRMEVEDELVSVVDRKMVVRHSDLKEIVAAIEEYFVKAATAGDELSDLLETGREQLDRSFRQLRKTVYHSNSVLSNLSSTWTSKPPLAIKYRLDTTALEDSGRRKSLCSTLERLLAWEKKLYEEVKTREGVKIEHKKKLSALQSQEYKGKYDFKMDKTKVSLQRLQSLILVTSQAVSATSSAIIKVRDDELAPQLVELCYGFMNMWRSMNKFHEIQNHIVQQVRGLVNYGVSVEATSDLHRQATLDLGCAVSDWHSSFTRLIKFHRDYIRALHAWLKLTVFPVSGDDTEKDHYSSLVSSELCAFCDDWKQALDRLPDTVAAEAIKSVVTVVNSISSKQVEESKIRKRVESYSKELEKKSLALRNIEKKFYQSYSTVGIGIPNSSDMHGQVFDARDPLSEKKIEIAGCRRKVEDEMLRHTNAIKVTREMTLNNIQTGLPGVFQAMTGFSGLFTEALEGVCRRTGSSQQ